MYRLHGRSRARAEEAPAPPETSAISAVASGALTGPLLIGLLPLAGIELTTAALAVVCCLALWQSLTFMWFAARLRQARRAWQRAAGALSGEGVEATAWVEREGVLAYAILTSTRLILVPSGNREPVEPIALADLFATSARNGRIETNYLGQSLELRASERETERISGLLTRPQPA